MFSKWFLKMFSDKEPEEWIGLPQTGGNRHMMIPNFTKSYGMNIRLNPSSISGAAGRTGKRPEPLGIRTVLFMITRERSSAFLRGMPTRKLCHAEALRKTGIH